MTFAHGRRGGVVLPLREVKTGSGRLSLESRVRIELRQKDGLSLRAIATELGAAASTVIDVPDDETARYLAGCMAVTRQWPQELHPFTTSGE